jgi:hypothetical protein
MRVCNKSNAADEKYGRFHGSQNTVNKARF